VLALGVALGDCVAHRAGKSEDRFAIRHPSR
jgi:hypothetical protein